jgi:hypothetical protein
MVVAGKIFRLSQSMSIANISFKLHGYHVEENYEEGDYKFKLVSEVINLEAKSNSLNGTFSCDNITHVFHRGTSAPLPQTVEAAFSFSQFQNTTFLTVVEKKRVANFIANKLSEILFEKVGVILEVRISPKTLSEFHHKNREDTKITFFDNVDIPNVNKLSLYGPDLINTSLFEDYTKHGDLWYVVAKSKETGFVVGITRDASVTLFNTGEKNKYVEYISKEIYPIILASA